MPYIENNFFNREYLATELPKIFDNHISDPVFSVFKTLYNKTKFEKLNEAQLEEEFIKPALQALGYAYAYQIQKKAFGKNHKPDFALFADDLLKNNHYNAEKDDTADILALCESKAYGITLDTGKISEKENPHFQIIRYLNDLKINFGFLTNGRLWRFYETSKNRAEKVFFEIDLEKIIEDDNLQYFNYFYFIFRKDAFTTTDLAILKTNSKIFFLNNTLFINSILCISLSGYSKKTKTISPTRNTTAGENSKIYSGYWTKGVKMMIFPF